MTASAPSPDQAAEDHAAGPQRDVEDDVLVRVSHVTKYYGRFKALDDVSLTIHRGEVVAVIGASGSGKSTLCRTVNRLEPIQEGEIEIDGIPLPQEGKALAQLRAEVGMVFQSFNLFPHRTVLDNITLAPVKVRGILESGPRPAPVSCWPASGWRIRPASDPRSSPEVSSSGSPSPAPWPWIPRSCSSTSPPAPWTRR